MSGNSRVPLQHFNNLRSQHQQQHASFLTPSSLHDLNAVDSRSSAAADASGLDADDDDSAAVECMHGSYGNSLSQIHSVGVEEDRSSRCGGYDDMLTIDDVSPIESARARFLSLIVDHFLTDHVIEVGDNEVNEYAPHPGYDKSSKRKPGEVQYEGDPRFSLPLMYVANLYETLVNEVNLRLASLSGIRDKTIGVALEASGGLYRKLVKKFPKKGTCVYRRRELATSLETRTRFPELVIQEEKRVRFVVVNGLDIVEKPANMSIEDSECYTMDKPKYYLPWQCDSVQNDLRFKRLTGRTEVTVSSRDYKFYSPRHKYRRVVSNLPGLPTLPGTDGSSTIATTQGLRSVAEHQSQQQTPPKHHVQPFPHAQYHQIHPNHHPHHQAHQSQHTTHFSQCGSPSHLPEMNHSNQSPTISQHMAYLQPLTGSHVGGRLHLMPASPAKYCDECGAPYLRETSKFCSECGTKRLGL